MNTWDERFATEDYAYGTEPNEFLVQAADHLPQNGDVLCLAEGEGRNAVWLAKRGYHVTAMDGSRAGLLKAARLAGEANVVVTLQAADLNGYTIAPARWDAIVAIWIPMPPDLRRRILRECVQGLKPGGAFVWVGYGPRQLEYGTGGPPHIEMLPTAAEVAAELDGLTIVHAADVDRPVLEGRYHSGMSAVVEVVGKKPA
ncbi:MAG TPA: class I SAM-dependent methyltransferase [Armatimonadota bacterium]|jgi:SAM-dependent methyltransferase